METSTQLINGICVVRLSGRFDSFNVTVVRDALQKIRTQSPKIVVNMRAVNFMDSSAIAVLVQEMKLARKNGGDVRLCELQEEVKIIFDLTRLNKAFHIFATESDALKSFSQ